MTWLAETIDSRGIPRRRELEAADRATALATLEKGERLALRRLDSSATAAPDLAGLAATAGDLRRLLETGFPLGEALSALAGVADEALARDLAAAAAAAAEGSSLADALSQGDTALSSEPVLTLLEAGEDAAKLPHALASVEGLLARLHDVRRQVLDAADYPLFLFPLAATLVAITVTAAGPTWHEIQRQFPDWPAPGATRLLVELSHWPLLVWGVAAVVCWATWRARRWLSRSLVRWPLTGAGPLPPPRALRQALICQGLAAQIEVGTPPPRAWRLLGALVAGTGTAGLEEGQSLGRALEQAVCLGPAEARAVDHAAEGGNEALAAELLALAGARQRRFLAQVGTATHLVELALLGSLGVAVLAVASQLFFSSAWQGF